MLYLDPSSRSPSECAAAQPIGDSVEKWFRPALCTENFPSRALPTILSGGVCSCRHLEWLSVTNRRGRSSIDRRCSPVDDRARIFEQHRARMCSVAYRMLRRTSDRETSMANVSGTNLGHRFGLHQRICSAPAWSLPCAANLFLSPVHSDGTTVLLDDPRTIHGMDHAGTDCPAKLVRVRRQTLR
jgi:hypothetical protein